MKYIDADKLIAEIERYKQGAAIARFDNAGENADFFQGKVDLCDDLTHIITSLQKEQPDNWDDEYREYELLTRFAFYTYKDEDDVLYLSNVFVEETSRNKGFGTKILAAAEKVAETIGAITIRLKAKRNSQANDWYRKHGYGYLTFEGEYDWLEKNLEYLKSKQEQLEACKTCGFYENNCPFIRGKLIPYPNKVCKDYIYSVMKEQEQLGGGYSEKPNNLLSEKQERTRGIDGVVHHSLRAHWIVTDQKQLATALKAFPEGTEVELFIFARKEDIVI